MGKIRQSGRNKKINSVKKIYNYYGRRVCHKLSQAKQKIIQEKLPKFNIKTSEIPIFVKSDLFFGRKVILEVGFGMGDNLKYMIDNDKDSLFIGCEPYLNGVANLIEKLNHSDDNRVKIFDKDVRFLLELIPNNFFSKIVILFPDPWKKRRHKKRRLFNKTNIHLFLNKLEKNGEIYFGTDIKDYFLEVRDFFIKKKKTFSIRNIENHYKKPSFLCLTKYAKKSLEKGVPPMYLVIKKKVDIL